MHNRFEQDGARLLHGFLECERARNLEGHVAGVHVVIFAVVEAHANIGDRKTRKKPTLSGIANAFFDGWNPVFGNGAAENIVHEFNALAPRQRLHLNAAKAKLAVAPGLFFVFAFGVSFAADGLAIRDLRRMEF